MITLGVAFILITLGRCWVAVANRPIRDKVPTLKGWESLLYGVLLIVGCALVLIRAVVWVLVNMP